MKFKIQNSKFKIAIQKSKVLFALFTFNFLLLTFVMPVYAQEDTKVPCPDLKSPGVDIGCSFGFGRGFANTLGDVTSKLVMPVFSLATFIVTWYFLWGAFDWITSEGDKQKVADARNKITQAIAGFLILILVFFILPFVLFKLFGVNLGIIKLI